MFRFAGFELDQQRDELRGPDGVGVKLRPKTFEMLRLFATNSGRVLSKQELMEAIWPNVHVGEDSLFQGIRELRTALGDDQRQMIKLVSGRGYVLTAEVAVLEPAPAPDAISPVQPIDALPASPTEIVIAPSHPQRSIFGLSGRVAAAAAVFCVVIGFAVAALVLRPDFIFKRTPPVIAVIPIVDASNDPRGGAMAGEVTSRLADGFARIDDIRIVTPQSPGARGDNKTALAASADFEIRGELQRVDQSWTLRSRIVKRATGEVQSVATITVDANDTDEQLQQTRLAAGAGHLLARRLNDQLEADKSPAANDSVSMGDSKVVIEQALASINKTTRERFGMAQTILQKALADKPDSVNVAVALSALQLRGIQMRWYSPNDAMAAEAHASTTLERALRARPNSIPVLETYCRFLSATNHFLESLVACARVLSFDPWNGGALYLVGLGQIFLGRFEDALATFQQADRFDTPAVSRWTWLLGAGWANQLMGRGADAVPWFQRSIAITKASGRTQMMLAAAYQQAGQFDEAKAAMQEGLKMVPGTTRLNVGPPTKNTSPIYLAATDKVIQFMVDAGLPEK
ncbi:winged helix-turn-helix domain-containing protein [Bradyrhizobium sp. SYSU BS000235]|uniref:winged helix-turn-helix domain-containing protein n=1 Tax=Bradyrhizobium sp. SYSU BS000235 TaxID=3411332 RepID=UPI003C731233